MMPVVKVGGSDGGGGCDDCDGGGLAVNMQMYA